MPQNFADFAKLFFRRSIYPTEPVHRHAA
jgi:hypothetical protein